MERVCVTVKRHHRCLMSAVITGTILVCSTAFALASDVVIGLGFQGKLLRGPGPNEIVALPPVDGGELKYSFIIDDNGIAITPTLGSLNKPDIITLTFLDGVAFSDHEDFYSASVSVNRGENHRSIKFEVNSSNCNAHDADTQRPADCSVKPTAAGLAKLTLPWSMLVPTPGTTDISITISRHRPDRGDPPGNATRSLHVVAYDAATEQSFVTLSKTYSSNHTTASGQSDVLDRVTGIGYAPLSWASRLYGVVNQDTGTIESQFAKTLKDIPLTKAQKKFAKPKCLSCIGLQFDEQSTRSFQIPQGSDYLNTSALSAAGADFVPFDWTKIGNLDEGFQFITNANGWGFGIASIAGPGTAQSPSFNDVVASASRTWGVNDQNSMLITTVAANHVGHTTVNNSVTGISFGIGEGDPVTFYGRYVGSNTFAGDDFFGAIKTSNSRTTMGRHSVQSTVVAGYRDTGSGYAPADGSVNEPVAIKGPMFDASVALAGNVATHPNFYLELSGYGLGDSHDQSMSNFSETAKAGLSDNFSFEYDGSHGFITPGLLQSGAPFHATYTQSDDNFAIAYDNKALTHLKVGFERVLSPSCKKVAKPNNFVCSTGAPMHHLSYEASRTDGRITVGARFSGDFAERRDNFPLAQPLQELGYLGYRFGNCDGVYFSGTNSVPNQGPLAGLGSAVNIIVELNDEPFEHIGTFYAGYNNTTGFAQPSDKLPPGTPFVNRGVFFKIRFGTSAYKMAVCGP